MYFEFSDAFYLAPDDFDEMVSLCKNEGFTPIQAICTVSQKMDDVDFYSIGYVEDQIVEAINNKLKEE